MPASSSQPAALPSPATDSLSFILSVLAERGARRVLDLGCGNGQLAASLREQGYEVAGVDPSPDQIAEARVRVPGALFVQGVAENLPADLHGFDAAIFLNSLHHVAPSRMEAAILGGFSALLPGSPVIIVEPAAAGSFFRAMRPVEDETAIRAAAMRAIDGLIATGQVVLERIEHWNRESRFPTLEDFAARLVEVEPERETAIRKNAEALAKAWRENIQIRDGMALLVQRLTGQVLGLRPRPAR